MRTPRIAPSASTAASTSRVSSRACPATDRFSARSSIHLTGRPSNRLATEIDTSSERTKVF